MWQLLQFPLCPFSRKVRLLLSAFAIILGVAFVAGTLVFTNALGGAFDDIIEGSTSDALVRTEGEVSFQASGAGTTKLVEPQVVDRLGELADAGVDFVVQLLDRLAGPAHGVRERPAVVVPAAAPSG